MKIILTSILAITGLQCIAQQPAVGSPQTQYVYDTVRQLSTLQIVKPIQFFSNHSTYTYSREEIQQMPIRNVGDVVGLVPGTYQQRSGNDVQLSGGRTSGNAVYVDGVRIADR